MRLETLLKSPQKNETVAPKGGGESLLQYKKHRPPLWGVVLYSFD